MVICVTHVQNFWSQELPAEDTPLSHQSLTRPLPGYVTPALLARRFLFDTVGQFNTALPGGDKTEWFLRAADQEAVMELLLAVVVYRRRHKTDLSHRQTAETLAEYLQVVKASLDRRRRQDSMAPASYQFPSSTRRGRT